MSLYSLVNFFLVYFKTCHSLKILCGIFEQMNIQPRCAGHILCWWMLFSREKVSCSWKIPWRRKWQPTPGILAWRIPWTEEPGGLQSMGSQRVGHDWATSLSLSVVFTNICDINTLTMTDFSYQSDVNWIKLGVTHTSLTLQAGSSRALMGNSTTQFIKFSGY